MQSFASTLCCLIMLAGVLGGTASASAAEKLVLDLTTGPVVILLRPDLAPQHVARIKELAALEMSGDRPLIQDERFREKLAAVEVELAKFTALSTPPARIARPDAKAR